MKDPHIKATQIFESSGRIFNMESALDKRKINRTAQGLDLNNC